MPSFDIVNQVDLQEIDNAINNTKKAVDTRYDFRGSKTEVSFDRKAKVLHVSTDDTMKLQQLQEMLSQNLVKRGVSPKAMDKKEPEPTSKGGVRQDMVLREGIEKDIAKKIVKMIKETKMKVQAQIQDDQVRVTGKKIDDLQEVIELLKGKDLEVPLQYVNMKS